MRGKTKRSRTLFRAKRVDLSDLGINDPDAMAIEEAGPSQPCPPALDIAPFFRSRTGSFALYHGDCREMMSRFPDETFDMAFADPPYFLSNSGITCRGGKMVSVNKGWWDRSHGFRGNYEFTRQWLTACQRTLKPNGSIWVSGTSHIIHIVGCVLDELGYKILNDITWVKPNPPPNLCCRYFTHATETIIWAGRDKKCRHKFNYSLMKRLNRGKQMTSVWVMSAPRKHEKLFGKHPTQKPLWLLERIIEASTDEHDLVLDPFSGAATTGIAAARLKRGFVGIDTELDYLETGIRRFVGVPQADLPERILGLARTYLNGLRSDAKRALALRVTERQIRYYRDALRILGLLSPGLSGGTLSQAGVSVASVSRDDGLRALAQSMFRLPLVKEVVRLTGRFKTTAARQRKVEELLAKSTALTGTTCARRARTILRWVDWMQSQLERIRDGARRDVASAAEEAYNAPVAENLKLLPNLGPDVAVGGMKGAQLPFEFVDLGE